MFTPEERERVRAALVDRAYEDPRITGAALTGSAARGEEDRWSDVDVFLGVDDRTDIDVVVRDWTEAVYRDERAVHHFDVRAPAGLYRVFLLESGLQVDVAFTAASAFGPGGPSFRALFGQPVEPAPAALPGFEDLAGLAWLSEQRAEARPARAERRGRRERDVNLETAFEEKHAMGRRGRDVEVVDSPLVAIDRLGPSRTTTSMSVPSSTPRKTSDVRPAVRP